MAKKGTFADEFAKIRSPGNASNAKIARCPIEIPMLIDSNVIIYAAQTHHIDLRQFIDEITPSVSVVSYIEVFGYHKLGEDERQYMEQFFQKN